MKNKVSYDAQRGCARLTDDWEQKKKVPPHPLKEEKESDLHDNML